MKAKQDFEIVTNKEGTTRVPYKGDSGVKVIKVKKGSEIPKEWLQDIVEKNPDFVEIEYSEGVPQNLPKGMSIPKPVVSKKAQVPKRKYTQNNLTTVYNKDGQDGLQKIAEEEFGIVVPKYTRYSKIINWILEKQEEQRRR